MEDLKTLQLSELLDRLSAQTYTFTKMLKYGASQEQFDAYRQEIHQLQEEIEFRKAFEAWEKNRDTTAA